MGKFINLTGQKFHRLTVLSRGENKGKAARWNCLCDCGNKTLVHGTALRSGHTKSCGCQRIDSTTAKNTTHGHTAGGYQNISQEYRAWAEAKRRCYTKSYHRYRSYGGRGINMCDSWRHNYENFLNDMGPKPTPHHTLDREDSDGNYEPTNCRWVTWSVQSKNRRRHHWSQPLLPEDL